MTEDTFTACTRCKHIIIKDGCTIWHHVYCGAIEKPKFRDPFDGVVKHDYMNEKHPHARDINKDGNCPHYEPALPLVNRIKRLLP